MGYRIHKSAGTIRSTYVFPRRGTITRELSEYKTPVKGLYITGPGSHPGGGVGGIPGRNTAKVVLEDIRGKVFGKDLLKYAAMSFEVLGALLSGESK